MAAIKTKIKALTVTKGVVICDVEKDTDARVCYPINRTPAVGDTLSVRKDGDLYSGVPSEPDPTPKK